MKYFIITYGCQMNEADSERIVAVLDKKGYKPAWEMKDADLVVVNMCSVRQSAVDRAFGAAHKLNKLKKVKPKIKTVLTGCIVKSDRKKFLKKFDEIWDNRKFLDNLPKCQKEFRAFIPISYGCNNFCSYCVVPYTRGPLSCRDHKKVIKEVKSFLKDKANPPSLKLRRAREIWLLGQNVNDYQSPADKSINFPKLLELVIKIPGDFKVRFMSPNPKNFSDELIRVMAKSEKIAKYLNLPVQSGDNQILKKMNRPYTAQQYKKLVKKIRKAMPNINLSTDVIVGFPGETRSQFENTKKLFKEILFDIAYISKYSTRSGTAASKMKDKITLQEKKKREKELKACLKNH